MKSFKELMIEQFTHIAKYEIEEVTEHKIEVWDKEDLHSLVFNFDDNGNLTDIF